MTKFVNTGEAVEHYHPGGHENSLHVEQGQVVDVGDANVEEQDDCYLVGSGDDVRAWPKSRWQMQVSRRESTRKDKPETPAE
jgi:hypothetical protein